MADPPKTAGTPDPAPGDLGERLLEHQQRLLRIVAFRMDPRLKTRIDPADVVQEAFVEATRRYDEYRADPQMPFFLWLRFLTVQTLFRLARHHLETQARDARQEVSIDQASSQATSAALAGFLLGKLTSPSEAAVRRERRDRVAEKLAELAPIDREILVLRHFEQLSNVELARVLGIQPSAASNRYVRAIRRLKAALEQHPDG